MGKFSKEQSSRSGRIFGTPSSTRTGSAPRAPVSPSSGRERLRVDDDVLHRASQSRISKGTPASKKMRSPDPAFTPVQIDSGDSAAEDEVSISYGCIVYFLLT